MCSPIHADQGTMGWRSACVMPLHMATRSLARTRARRRARTRFWSTFPTLSILGPQGSGPLPWDTPNRVLSWGWLPLPVTKKIDFVYTVGVARGIRLQCRECQSATGWCTRLVPIPDFFSFSPGLEIRFHWRKYYLGLRGVLENATDHSNPLTVNNVTDSPQFLTFSNFEGRSTTARLRILGNRLDAPRDNMVAHGRQVRGTGRRLNFGDQL